MAALRIHACAQFLDAVDNGNPFAKGNAAAKAVVDPDPMVRSALALLSPSFVAGTQRPTKTLQATRIILQKIAGYIHLTEPSMPQQSCTYLLSLAIRGIQGLKVCCRNLDCLIMLPRQP